MAFQAVDLRLLVPSCVLWSAAILGQKISWQAWGVVAIACVALGVLIRVWVTIVMSRGSSPSAGSIVEAAALWLYVLALSFCTAAVVTGFHSYDPQAIAAIENAAMDFFTSSTPLLGEYAQERRAEILEAVADMPEFARGLIPGVVIGEDSALPRTEVEQMRMLGLAHITAVSGAHVSLVLGAVIGLVGKQYPRLAAAAGLVALYWLIVIVGPEASVLRAGMMGVLMVCGVWSSRRVTPLPLACIVVIIASIFFRDLAGSLGFRLSVVCTMAIVVFAYPLTNLLNNIMPRWAAQMMALPLIAGLASVPLIAGIQEKGSIWSVTANALVAPVVPSLTICGLAAVLVFPIAPWLAHSLLAVCKACTWWIHGVTQALSSFPGSEVDVWVAAGVNVLSATPLIVSALYTRRCARVRTDLLKKLLTRLCIVGHDPMRFTSERRRWRMMRLNNGRRQSWSPLWRKNMKRKRVQYRRNKRWKLFSPRLPMVILLLSACALAFLGAHRMGWVRFPVLFSSIDKDWEIVQCDVGQGSALLARRSGETVLVDTGPEHGNIDRCLRQAGVSSLDLLVISHFDADHVRGLNNVLTTVRVNEAWVSENTHPHYNSGWALDLLRRYGVKVESVRAGAQFGAEDWLAIESPTHPSLAEDDANLDSLVVRVRTEHYSVLNLADISAEIQENLAATAQPADVVIVAHHGSASQSPELSQVVNPRVALISVGRNSYGHPTDKAIEVWAAPIEATTYKCGYIALLPSGVDTERHCELVADS